LNKPAKTMKVPGQGYGEQAKQVAAQKAIPMAGAAQPPTRPPLEQLLAGAPSPDSVPGMFEPTQRPYEPVTAGLPIGPGEGSDAMAAPNMFAPEPGVDELRAVYAVFPYPGIKALLQFHARKRQ
jgi:hypothetical protein